jgi:hypothetical protein
MTLVEYLKMAYVCLIFNRCVKTAGPTFVGPDSINGYEVCHTVMARYFPIMAMNVKKMIENEH